MQRRAGKLGELPHTTVNRILRQQTLPHSEAQCRAFLTACEVSPRRAEAWIETWRRVSGALQREEAAATDRRQILQDMAGRTRVQASTTYDLWDVGMAPDRHRWARAGVD